MAESPATPLILPASDIRVGWKHPFGPLSVSEAEIMEFARIADPQPIHLDHEAAKQSRFGGIIASGLHPYLKFHIHFWIPLTAAHFICGIGLDGSRFYLPVYPDMPLNSELQIIEVVPKPEKGAQFVSWQWDFATEEGKPVSFVKFTTYHQLANLCIGARTLNAND
jgi:acyl dehydratase